MSNAHYMIGLDTLEVLGVGTGRGKEFDAMSLDQREGPKISSYYFGFQPGRVLYLYPEQLDLLYKRFTAANPSGVVAGTGDLFYREYAPKNLSQEAIENMENQGKIFVHLFDEYPPHPYPYVRKYLPELFEPGVVEKMHRDPWLNVHLLGQAVKEGFVPDGPGETSRWFPEWRAYCDRLIASGEYK
jgi:hypothetical protein